MRGNKATCLVIGVNRVSIFSMIFMCFMKLNARFTPLSLRKTLISHFLIFCRFRRKNQAKCRRNQVKRKLLIYSSLEFATTKDMGHRKEEQEDLKDQP